MVRFMIGKKWEYLSVLLDMAEMKATDIALNTLGEKGWELVSITPITLLAEAVWIVAVLKRQRPNTD